MAKEQIVEKLSSAATFSQEARLKGRQGDQRMRGYDNQHEGMGYSWSLRTSNSDLMGGRYKVKD